MFSLLLGIRRARVSLAVVVDRTFWRSVDLCPQAFLLNATMYQETGARHCVYLTCNTRVYIRECCCAAKNLGVALERCQIHASARKSVVLVFHNGGLKAALNTKA